MAAGCGELAREFFERFWNQRDAAAFDEMSAPESMSHLPDGTTITAQQFRDAQYPAFLGSFPDLHIEIEDVLESGDRAVVRWFAKGTHGGDAMGIPASGRNVGFRGMTWFQFRDGRIAAGWNCWDHGGLMHQLAQTAAAD